VITIIHDVSFKVFPRLIRFFDRLLLSIFIPPSLRRADKIIGVSRFTKEEIERCYAVPEEKLEWVHNAVSEEILERKFTPEEEKSVRERYGLPENFILYLGTKQPRKNIPLLIRAFSDLSKLFPEIKLVLAGGRGYNSDPEIDKEIGKLDLKKNIIFTGFVSEEDKACLFHLAKIFCFPSLYEGFGIPILEAFAIGTPVIASRIPPHMEIAGNSALLFNPQDQSTLFNNLRKLLESPEETQELRRRGWKNVKGFSWEKTAEETLSLYREVGGFG
jgi:glycosyltransferase involved in cell wall biosynthesis